MLTHLTAKLVLVCELIVGHQIVGVSLRAVGGALGHGFVVGLVETFEDDIGVHSIHELFINVLLN